MARGEADRPGFSVKSSPLGEISRCLFLAGLSGSDDSGALLRDALFVEKPLDKRLLADKGWLSFAAAGRNGVLVVDFRAVFFASKVLRESGPGTFSVGGGETKCSRHVGKSFNAFSWQLGSRHFFFFVVIVSSSSWGRKGLSEELLYENMVSAVVEVVTEDELAAV